MTSVLALGKPPRGKVAVGSVVPVASYVSADRTLDTLRPFPGLHHDYRRAGAASARGGDERSLGPTFLASLGRARLQAVDGVNGRRVARHQMGDRAVDEALALERALARELG